MRTKRKTMDQWQLHVDYGQGWEHELSEDTYREICKRRNEYAENAPQYPRKVVRRRVPLETVDPEPRCAMNGEWTYRPGNEELPAVMRPVEGGLAYVGQFNSDEDARLCAAAPEMAKALQAALADLYGYRDLSTNGLAVRDQIENALRKAGRCLDSGEE